MRILFLSLFFTILMINQPLAVDLLDSEEKTLNAEETPKAEKINADDKKSGIFSFMNFSFGKKEKELVLPSDIKKAEEEKQAEEKAKPETEFEKLNRTAEEGNLDSQLALGYIYLYGNADIKPDYDKAFKFYAMAASQNDKVAINNLGSLYYSGIGVDKDVEKAAFLFDKAAQLGNSESAVNLAFIYLSGRDIKKNVSESIRLFTQAADDNNPAAQFMLGYAYYKGFVVKKNLIKGFELIKSSAASNYDVAQYFLAKMYIDGSGTAQNYGNAVSLLTRSANQGNLDAMMDLGNIYATGSIYTPSVFQAHVLFNVASVQGIQEAAAKRDVLEKVLKIEDLLQAQAQAESFKPAPSEITQYIQKTFGKNIQNYIENNMREMQPPPPK